MIQETSIIYINRIQILFDFDIVLMVISLVRTELVTWEEALVSANMVELWQLVLDFPVLTIP